MGHGHSHSGKKCHGHGSAHGHGQHQQQPREMTYDQVMADPVLRERLQKQRKNQKRMRGAIQIFALIACFSFFWFYGGAIDEYLDPPADHHAAVQARLRAAHSTTTSTTTSNNNVHSSQKELIAEPVTWLHSNREGQTYLRKNHKEDGVVQLKSGVQYKVLTSGKGKFHPTLTSPCVTHYEGKLVSGTVFDSSYQRGSPATFAPNQVIRGWTEVMQLMVEGDIWEVSIPSDLAYGTKGSGKLILGGDTLIFKMNIIKIKGDRVPVTNQN